MFDITEGAKPGSFATILYGPPGSWKSELASHCSKPLFLDLEEGTRFLDVKRIKAKDFESVLRAFGWIMTQPQFDTFVVDGLTQVARMATDYTKASLGVKQLSEVAWGGGTGALRDNMRRFIRAFEAVRDKGTNVIVLAHSKVKPVKDPTQDSYDCIEFDCEKEIVNEIAAACDGVFLLRPQIRSTEKDGDRRVLASGKRELILSDKGGVLAKSRFNIGQSIEFDYHEDKQEREQQYKQFWSKICGH